MASLTGNLVAETYKALLKTIDNDILTASEKQITDGLGGGSNVFIDSNGFLRANKYKVTNGLATQFLKADGSLDANTYLTSITGAQVITALGYTPVTDQRTLTINGVTYNLTANRSWTVAGTAAVWGNITGTLSNQTDLQAALNAKFNVPAGTISQYIRGDGTLATFPTLPGGLPIGGTTGQILSKIDATDYNAQWIDNFATQTKNEVKLGQTLSKGAAVYVSSANGTNMIVSAASNASESLSSKTFGLLETGGVTNDLVKCVTFGLLAGLDTSTAQAGDPVWLGVNGALLFGVANKPVAPANMVYIGVVTRVQQNNGEIFVNVQNGFEIEELHDVLIQSKANNQGLFYESSTGLWKNKSIATVLGYTPQAQLNGTGFVKASGTTISYDNSTYLTTADAASTYQLLTNLSTDLTASATKYPSVNAVIAGLATKQPLDADLTAIAALAGTSGFLIKTAADTWSLDTNTYLTTATAASTYQRLDKMVSNLLASDTEYPNSNAVIAALALKANAANPVFTGNMTISGAEPKLFFTDTDNNPDYTVFIDSGFFYIYDQTAGATRFSINSSGNISTGVGKSITAGSFVRDGGTASQYLMADGTVSTFAGITGSGTATRVAFFDGTNSISSSSGLFYDNTNSRLSIGTSTPTTARLTLAANSDTDAISLAGFQLLKWNSGDVLIFGGYEASQWQQVKFFAGGTQQVQITTASANFENSIVVKGIYNVPNSSYFISGANGYRFNNSADTFNNVIMYDNGNTYTRGNVLIGTTTDSGYKLDVIGSAKFNGPLRIVGASNSRIVLESDYSGGNVGITLFNTAGTENIWLNSANGSINCLGPVNGGQANFTSTANTYAGGALILKQVGGINPVYLTSSGGYFALSNGGTTDHLIINSTGVTTFSNTVTASSFIKSGGTSAQFLKADGSIDSSTYLTTAGAAAQYQPIGTYPTGSGSVSRLARWTSGSNLSVAQIWDDGTNIGIGQAPGAFKLDVTGTGRFSGTIVANSGGGQIQIGGGSTLSGIFQGSSTNTLFIGDWNTATKGLTINVSNGNTSIAGDLSLTPTNSALTFSSGFARIFVGSTESIRITSGANVLVGTQTDGGYRFDVAGQIRSFSATPLVVSMSSNGANDAVVAARWQGGVGTEMRYFPNEALAYFDNTYPATGGQVFGDIRFRVNSGGTMTPVMTVKANNTSVGIGTINPVYKLHVSGGSFYLQGTNGNSRTVLYDNYSSGAVGMQMFNNSGVSVIDLNANVGNANLVGSVTASSFFESSDFRLKTLIEHNPIVAGIENLQAKLYEKNGKIELGYFAQDAELIMPYAVTKNADGFLNLSYREVHTAKIARLEQRVAELEKQLNLN